MEEQNRRWSAQMPDIYDQVLVPVTFAPFATDLAARVAGSAPRRVLELAAGTGVVTQALLAEPGCGRVVATDLNPGMVEVGRRRVPDARWEVADALSLPYDADEFDAVVCQFGVMFFPDKVAGMAEALRVLAAGGTFYANSWGPLESHEFEAAYMTAVRTVIPDDPPTFLADVPHGYADPEQLAEDARTAGFRTVAVETITLQTGTFTAYDAAMGYCGGTPMRAGLESHGDLDELSVAIAQETERLLGRDPTSARMTANVLAASAG
ncbi:MAG TPA: methyltransferase domain-containing protein [Mycobacteriales bacterium]|nr:methyltransferase domain-containing protein [Mycobacteriales bacterium]